MARRGRSHQVTEKPIFTDLDQNMRIQTLVALAAALLPGIVLAQGYGVVAVGLSELSSDCTGTTTCDKTDVAVKLIGGYKFAPSFAGELSYFRLGKATASVGSVSGEVKNAAFGAGVAYHADGPESHSAFRLGAARVTTKVNGTIAGVGSAGDSDTNIALVGGISAGWKWTKKVSIDAAWDATRAKYNKNGVNESGTINFFSMGVTFWY